MRKINILDCGPSLLEVSKIFGQSPNWIMESLKDKNCEFNWVKSYLGEKFNINDSDAWIITGSPRSVYEEESWMLYVEKQLKNIQDRKILVLGICFGHQLIAKTFGGKVEKNPKGWELGSYPIFLTKKGQCSELFTNFSSGSLVYESHQDVVTYLPPKAVKLAYNEKCIQAFKLNDYLYSVQFHPEFSIDIMNKYVTIRGASGANIDNPEVLISTKGESILHNFIDLI